MEPANWAALIDEAEKGLVEGTSTADKRLAFRLAVADGIMTELRYYKPPAFPDRPAAVTDDNYEVYAAIKRAPRARAAPEDKQLAATFVRWREEVVALEARSAGSLLLLLDALITYQDVQEAGGDNDSIGYKVELLTRHIAHHWRELDDALLSRDRLERQSAAQRACRQAELLPSWLLNNDAPPRRVFVPGAHRPNEAEEESEE